MGYLSMKKAAIDPSLYPALFELKQASAYWKYYSLADLAHVQLLKKSRLISAPIATKLKAALLKLHAQPTTPADLRPEIGDLYKNREDLLKKEIPEDYGWISTSRSRREVNTIAYHLLMRDQLTEVMQDLRKLILCLAKVSQQHSKTYLSDYTYLQKAQPTSFGHYLLGFAYPLGRDLERLGRSFRNFNSCPGAIGSTNGSTFPLDRNYLSKLLGFQEPMEHTRDSMWPYDLSLECMSTFVSISVTISRLCSDFHVWCSEEFSYISLGEKYSRKSVIMPQKNNPYAISYLRGISAKMIGQFQSVVVAQLTPTAQIDNRLLAYDHLPEVATEISKNLKLLTDVVKTMKIHKESMLLNLNSSQAWATDLVDALMQSEGINHQTAYHWVQKAMEAKNSGPSPKMNFSAFYKQIQKISQAHAHRALRLGLSEIKNLMDPKKSVQARNSLGGANPESVRKMSQKFILEIQKNEKIFQSSEVRIQRQLATLLPRLAKFKRETPK
jgi:argininosuccinate lyase